MLDYVNIEIVGKDIQIKEDFEAYAQKKVDKLARYLPNITDIHVDMAQQHSSRGPNIIVAQITVRHSRGAILRAEEKLPITDHDTPKTALNGAVDKMYRRIRRFKDKQRSKDKKLHERYMASVEELALAEAMPDESHQTTDDGGDDLAILRRKQVQLTPMSEDEAIEQMELLGHTFFMFLNANTQDINVLYKRGNGGYGLLQPDFA